MREAPGGLDDSDLLLEGMEQIEGEEAAAGEHDGRDARDRPRELGGIEEHERGVGDDDVEAPGVPELDHVHLGELNPRQVGIGPALCDDARHDVPAREVEPEAGGVLQVEEEVARRAADVKEAEPSARSDRRCGLSHHIEQDAIALPDGGGVLPLVAAVDRHVIGVADVLPVAELSRCSLVT